MFHILPCHQSTCLGVFVGIFFDMPTTHSLTPSSSLSFHSSSGQGLDQDGGLERHVERSDDHHVEGFSPLQVESLRATNTGSQLSASHPCVDGKWREFRF